jgi:hypothetical protein
MATDLDKKVIAILKSGPLKAADKVDQMVAAGVPRPQVSLFLYRLEHVADPSLDLTKKNTVRGKQLEKAMVDARKNEGLRFERIAYRAGLVTGDVKLGTAVNQVKDILRKNGVDPDAYIGRGARRNGASAAPASSGRRGAPARKAQEPVAQGAASGRRGRAAAATAAAAPATTTGRGRRGTRADAKASDPK